MLNDRHSWLLFGGNLLNKIESCQINTLCAKVTNQTMPGFYIMVNNQLTMV